MSTLTIQQENLVDLLNQYKEAKCSENLSELNRIKDRILSEFGQEFLDCDALEYKDNEYCTSARRKYIHLKECPFCGYEHPILEKKGRTFIRGIQFRSAFVRCPKCNAISTKFSCEDFDQNTDAYYLAAIAWNMRATNSSG